MQPQDDGFERRENAARLFTRAKQRGVPARRLRRLPDAGNVAANPAQRAAPFDQRVGRKIERCAR
jgi:hypothetical protein